MPPRFEISLLPLTLKSIALFLDVDGTLYEIEKRPSLVRPCFKLQKKLYLIRNRLEGGLCLVSGRSIADLNRIFDKYQITLAGNHGGQVKDALRDINFSTNTKKVEKIAFKIQEIVSGKDNIEIENKGSNLTVHFRNSTSDTKVIKRKIIMLLKHEPELIYLEGKEVLEIKPLWFNKGTAISYFMKTKPFINRKPIFIGDDVSDEDGFETVNKKNGWSVRVGKFKKTKANYFLPNVKSVHKILNHLLMIR